MQESKYLEGNQQLADRFRNLPFLASLDPKQVGKLLNLSKVRKYEPGETITVEGVFDCWVYFLISGKVRVLKKGEEITCLDKIGETFGELAVIDGETRSATIEALTETVCLATDASFLDRLSETERPAFYAVVYRLFAEIVAQRLRATNEELVRVKAELEHLKKKA